MIRCKTAIAFGAPNMAADPALHSGSLGTEEVAGTRENLGWYHPVFSAPADIMSAWEALESTGRLRMVVIR